MPFRPCFTLFPLPFPLKSKEKRSRGRVVLSSGFPLHFCHRRNGAEGKNSLSFSFPFLLLLQEEKMKRKTFIPFLFPFFLLFQKENEKEKRFLFLLFSLPFREEKSSSFFSSSEEEMRGEKWEKKEGERRRERERIFALLGKFLLSYDNNYFEAISPFSPGQESFPSLPLGEEEKNIVKTSDLVRFEQGLFFSLFDLVSFSFSLLSLPKKKK